MFKFEAAWSIVAVATCLVIACKPGVDRQRKAQETLRMLSRGLDQHYLNHGQFPEFNSFDAMVSPNSILVKERLIPSGVPRTDPWGQNYEGRSTQTTYLLKCFGDPRSPDSNVLSREPGKINGPAENY